MKYLKPIDKHTCLKCGDEHIIPGLELIDKNVRQTTGSTKLEIEITGDPNALFDKEKYTSPIEAFLCTSCGFIELYATDPGQIIETYESIKKRLLRKIK